ncbi:hypothetical protein [Cupriavidus oxalaticus]|uniref:hypothetical protein n=1 Tax=Cupriavidus oxalaticus TaxID=96344 RepID=UPI003F7382F8
MPWSNTLPAKDPEQYIDSAVRITLRGLAVEKRRALKATETSRELVAALPEGVRRTWRAGS